MGAVELHRQWFACIEKSDLAGAAAIVNQAERECKSEHAKRFCSVPLRIQQGIVGLFFNCLKHGDRESAEEYLTSPDISEKVRALLQALFDKKRKPGKSGRKKNGKNVKNKKKEKSGRDPSAEKPAEPAYADDVSAETDDDPDDAVDPFLALIVEIESEVEDEVVAAAVEATEVPPPEPPTVSAQSEPEPSPPVQEEPAAAVSSSSDEEKPLRKRGRPRKPQSAEAARPKRNRGRPRKHPAVPAVQEASAVHDVAQASSQETTTVTAAAAPVPDPPVPVFEETLPPAAAAQEPAPEPQAPPPIAYEPAPLPVSFHGASLTEQFIACIACHESDAARALLEQLSTVSKRQNIQARAWTVQLESVSALYACLDQGKQSQAREMLKSLSGPVRRAMEQVVVQGGPYVRPPKPPPLPEPAPEEAVQLPIADAGEPPVAPIVDEPVPPPPSEVNGQSMEAAASVEVSTVETEERVDDPPGPKKKKRPITPPSSISLQEQEDVLWKDVLSHLQEFEESCRAKSWHAGRVTQKEIFSSILMEGREGIPSLTLRSNFWRDDMASQNTTDAISSMMNGINKELKKLPGCPKIVLDPQGRYRIVVLRPVTEAPSEEEELGIAIMEKLSRSQLLAFRSLWRNREKCTHPGELCFALWGDTEFTIKRRNAIKQMVGKLRKQLQKIPGAKMLSIQTNVGVGYTLHVAQQVEEQSPPESSTISEAIATLDA